MKVLIAEDERDMSRVMKATLELKGYEVDVANDGVEALELSEAHAYDCMVLDIMMPRMDGLEALSRMRAEGIVTPAIMLTAKAEIEDRVAGLDAGADDYLTKPFAMQELLARIRSQTRRQDSFTASVLTLGNTNLDVATATLSAENSVGLSARENKVLEALLLNPERPFTTVQLIERAWSDEPDVNQEVVWINISYLRNKLFAIGADIEICGERGASYYVRLLG